MSKLSVFEKNLVDFACLSDKRLLPDLHALVFFFATILDHELEEAPVRREAGVS